MAMQGQRWRWPSTTRSIRGLELALAVALASFGCQEPNPDFDGPANSTTSGGTSSSGSTTAPSDTTADPTMAGTAGGTSGSTTDTPPGTTTGSTTSMDGSTTSGSSGGSTTDACMGMVCMGVCIDPQTDNDNCGMCDNKCPGQQQCVTGECMMV